MPLALQEVLFLLLVGDLDGGLGFLQKFAPSSPARMGLASWLLWSAWLEEVLLLRPQNRRNCLTRARRQWFQNHPLRQILQTLPQQV